MRVTIKHSVYCEVPVGTPGTLIKPYQTGWAVEVRCNFTVPGANPTHELKSRILFFEQSELDFSTPDPSLPETKTQEPSTKQQT